MPRANCWARPASIEPRISSSSPPSSQTPRQDGQRSITRLSTISFAISPPSSGQRRVCSFAARIFASIICSQSSQVGSPSYSRRVRRRPQRAHFSPRRLIDRVPPPSPLRSAGERALARELRCGNPARVIAGRDALRDREPRHRTRGDVARVEHVELRAPRRLLLYEGREVAVVLGGAAPRARGE